MCVLLSYYCTSGCKEIELINHLVTKYLIENVKTKQVTLIVKSIDEISSLSMFIVRKLVETFPSFMIHIQEWKTMKKDDAKLLLMKKILKLRSERSSLKVMVLDFGKDSGVIEELTHMIEFMSKRFKKVPRGKCIVFLTNQKKSPPLRTFFQFAWSKNFLDLTVIELTQEDDTKHYCFDIVVHHFNPFYNIYNQEMLTVHTNIFPNKLYNFNGYSLYTSFFEDIPFVMIDRNYTGNNIWDMIHGLDVSIIKALAETLNFTAVVNIVNSENPIFRRFNVTMGSTDRAIADDAIDFAVNFYAIVGVPFESFNFETCELLFPFSNHLIVKQFNSFETSVSCDLLVTLCMVFLTILIFSTLTKLLHFNNKIWTFHTILKILIGRKMKHQDSLKGYEKIFFLYIIVVSTMLSLQLLEQLLSFYLFHEKFLKLHTLQDLVNSGIIPSITNDSKVFLSNSDYPPLQNLLAHSTTIGTDEEVSECVNNLLTTNMEHPVNGCEVNTVLGKLISKSFSKNDNGWIISFVSEPLQPAWTTLVVTPTSPYGRRFDFILRKFYEAGLIFYWYKATTRNYSLNYKELTGDARLHADKLKSPYMNHFYDKRQVPLNMKLIVVLIFGHIAACAVFACEMIWKRFNLENCALLKINA